MGPDSRANSRRRSGGRVPRSCRAKRSRSSRSAQSGQQVRPSCMIVLPPRPGPAAPRCRWRGRAPGTVTHSRRASDIEFGVSDLYLDGRISARPINSRCLFYANADALTEEHRQRMSQLDHLGACRYSSAGFPQALALQPPPSPPPLKSRPPLLAPAKEKSVPYPGMASTEVSCGTRVIRLTCPSTVPHILQPSPSIRRAFAGLPSASAASAIAGAQQRAAASTTIAAARAMRLIGCSSRVMTLQ